MWEDTAEIWTPLGCSYTFPCLPQHPSPPTPKSSTLSLPPGWAGRALGTSMTAASDQRTCRGRRGGESPAQVSPSQVDVTLHVPSCCPLPTAEQPTAHG